MTGTRGAGKSSPIRALLQAYHSEGLRVIEIARDDSLLLVRQYLDSPLPLDNRFNGLNLAKHRQTALISRLHTYYRFEGYAFFTIFCGLINIL